MQRCVLKAVKFESSNLSDCEAFFVSVFGFAVTHRYSAEAFEEIVMTLGGEGSLMLKFVQFKGGTTHASGATIQIRLDAIENVIAAARARRATVKMAPTCYPDVGVEMAVITTDQGLDIELVREL